MTSNIITPTVARRLAVTKQGLAGPKPAGIMDVFDQIGCVQIDPIRAVERTQYLVLWSRLGQYDRDELYRLQFEAKALFEFWAHAASIVRTADYQFHLPIMGAYKENSQAKWVQRSRQWLADNDSFRRYIVDELRQHGTRHAKQLEDRSVVAWQSSGWNSNRNITMMLNLLWDMGEIVVADRQGLKKSYALAENWFPESTPCEPLTEWEHTRRAAQQSLQALGVATAKQISNHFIRGRYPQLAAVLAELEAEGVVRQVTIADGETEWAGEWYVHQDDMPLLEALAGKGWQPRTVLLSPFDNLICDRDRTELLWDFYFRIEIYVPKTKRQYGYYVLPILHGERLIGRIDPKMDRKKKTLHVYNVYAEESAPLDGATGRSVHTTIVDLARFLGAKKLVYGENVPAGWQSELVTMEIDASD